MVKWEGKIGTLYQIFTIDLRVILLIIVATGVYALLLKFLHKNSPHNVQTKGGGVKGLLNNVKKLHFSLGMASLRSSSARENFVFSQNDGVGH